ncbi:hypothetical protein B0T16DRAFT_248063 [Cercophora newfieldiana]|uniref:Uncharacterized protein n=1 Tax=Cercophora newfieldiana TaxID=92897 RepID=A0AA40CJU1_9PEZI|nr:hypothetical protein B0T16DRAFT_248063 [Cercophora newfieldiana]
MPLHLHALQRNDAGAEIESPQPLSSLVFHPLRRIFERVATYGESLAAEKDELHVRYKTLTPKPTSGVYVALTAARAHSVTHHAGSARRADRKVLAQSQNSGRQRWVSWPSPRPFMSKNGGTLRYDWHPDPERRPARCEAFGHQERAA